MINRYELVKRHNPILNEITYDSPLTVGNGEFAFTCDVTGMQTIYEEHKLNNVPLCTMSQWGWHVLPVSDEKYEYTMDDLIMTEYDFNGRRVKYAVEQKPGNEMVYQWLRQNPHRLNLGRISFIYEGEEIKEAEITHIHQELKLYEGIIESSFRIHDIPCKVYTACHFNMDILGFRIESPAFADGTLRVRFSYPYGSGDITASDWEQPEKHTSNLFHKDKYGFYLERNLDKNHYYMKVKSEQEISLKRSNLHSFDLSTLETSLNFSVLFSEEITNEVVLVEEVFESSAKGFKSFWENGGMVDLHNSKDERAIELERRIILSQYLLAIQSSGSLPPQETGLTCNSWYGKFHLEMHLWHSAYAPLWNRSEKLERSFKWYQDILDKAQMNAGRNGYKGARWPKMVGPEGIDSPSVIATLLVWQQPHIIYMLELVYQGKKNQEFLNDYWEIMKETADFMSDFVVYDEKSQTYNLYPPIIPAQEEHNPSLTKNPTFEVEYWRFALNIAYEWGMRLGYKHEQWKNIAEHMAKLPEKDNVYLAHENCPDTFLNFKKDHPSMVGAYGLIGSERISEKTMGNTLDKVLKEWDFTSMWGWDFAMMAMTAVRLKKPELAIDVLLMDTHKNYYAKNGNNYQKLRKDLPLYLPGNGSLLLAVSMMTAGCNGCLEELPGFPKNGLWEIEYENINPFPY